MHGSRGKNSRALLVQFVHLSLFGPREKGLVHYNLLQNSIEMRVFFPSNSMYNMESFDLLKWYRFFCLCLPARYLILECPAWSPGVFVLTQGTAPLIT